MLWKTLYDRIGKQPLSFTQHNHVRAVIDGKERELDLKYDAKGRPYLVERTSRVLQEGVKI